MRNFFRTGVGAFVLGLSGCGFANAATLTMIHGYYPFKPGASYSIIWTGGPPGGTVYLTVDRKTSGSWTQPYRWLKLTSSGLTPTTLSLQSIPNVGHLAGTIPPSPVLWQCGAGVSYRVVVFKLARTSTA